MCGIYGVLARGGAVDPAALPAMDSALVHRGPDDNGTLLDGPCALGSRRLAIIDVGGGHQPIASEDRAVWVVMNGEIYNFRTLRQRLQKRGHVFASNTDTEVLVHLYEQHGEAFVDELRGMFAFALWDRRVQKLLIGRDRLGIKPLYYAETAAGLVFGSELRALLAHPSVGRALDPAALSHYLSFGTTPDDRAIIAGVRKLPPAHLLVAREGRVESLRRWWSLRTAPDAPSVSEDDAAERIRGLVDDAVRSHLESDVEVGAFLSGGVDSSAVVATMARAGHRPWTFSVGFGERDFDELAWARLVADRYGTRHEEIEVRADAWTLLGDVVAFLDEPFADVSAIPTFLVSRLAASRVKVVLSGDGGDEVFGGYDHYAEALADARRFDRLPDVARRAVGRLAAALPDRAPGKRWLRHASLASRVRFLDGESLFAADQKARLVSRDLTAMLQRSMSAADLEPLEARARLLDRAPGDALGRLMWLDTMTYLPLDILTKVDRMSMAHSLEVRPPLLDTTLVEAAARLPSSWKIAGDERKRIFKRAMADRVPAEILARRKQGFGVPIHAWFRGPLAGALVEMLLDRRTVARGLFDPRYVRGLLDEHRAGRRDHALRLYALLVLELWTRAVVEGEGRAAPPVGVRRG